MSIVSARVWLYNCFCHNSGCKGWSGRHRVKGARIHMELAGSTYNQPLASDLAAAKRAGAVQAATFQPAESNRTSGTPSGKTPEQKGFQPAGQPADEFRPYTGSGSQKSKESAGSETSQSDVASANSQKKQDPQVQAEIEQLKAGEEKVKAHEAAHKSVGGALTGPVSYTYTRGPDGKNYITGGEVPITVSPGKTPQETIRRMQQVIQAALAPADPSPQDRAVAAQATAEQQKASQEQAAASVPITQNTSQSVSYYA